MPGFCSLCLTLDQNHTSLFDCTCSSFSHSRNTQNSPWDTRFFPASQPLSPISPCPSLDGSDSFFFIQSKFRASASKPFTRHLAVTHVWVLGTLCVEFSYNSTMYHVAVSVFGLLCLRQRATSSHPRFCSQVSKAPECSIFRHANKAIFDFILSLGFFLTLILFKYDV